MAVTPARRSQPVGTPVMADRRAGAPAAARRPTADAASPPVELLEQIQDRVLWLAVRMIHEANVVRPNIDGVKVGGHQSSSASVVSILTELYFHWLRRGDLVAVKPHASPAFHAIEYLHGQPRRDAT